MLNFEKMQVLQQKNIFIKNLLDSPAKLQVMTGPDVGFSKPVSEKSLYRPQLVLAGFVELFNAKRIQIFGNTEFFDPCIREDR